MAESKVLKGSGGGGGSQQSRAPTRTPDNLISTDLVEVIFGVSEGPIKGLVNGARSFYAADTPFVSADGTPNTGNFELIFHRGGNPADPIQPRLGGFGNNTSVSVELETNVPVVRRGQQTEIDAIEIRMVFQRLVIANDDGEFNATGSFRVEIKPASSSVWQLPFTGSVRPTEQAVSSIQTIYGPASDQAGNFINPSRRLIFAQPNNPGTVSGVRPIWFDTSNSHIPRLWNGTSWVFPSNLTSGTTTNPNYPFWQWVEEGVTRRAYIGNVGSPPRGMSQFDVWVTPQAGLAAPALVFNGSSWVPPQDPVPATSPGVVSITGKTTTAYVKEIRIPVPRINEPYDIRITKTSGPNTTSYFCDLVFESFQELRRDPLVFNDLACAHFIIKSSNQFSSIPEFTSECEGRIVRVPSNYNPVTKTYTGVWDGTFKLEYTDNPAWVAYDLVMNDRYGMNAYRPVFLDKYATYEFSRHCDHFGFTFNDYIQEPRSVSEAVNYILGLAGGRLIDQEDGFASIIFDNPEQNAVALFTAENVVDGLFVYSFTDIAARKNDITVSFINPALNWREDRRRIFDQSSIDKFGRVAEEFIAVGCIDEAEAIRRARLRLAASTRETCIVNFKTNRMGLYIKPFDVILIADQDADFGITGRIRHQVDATTLELRDPVFLEAGMTYRIKFQRPVSGTGYVIETRTITGPAGLRHTLTVNSPLPTLPELATFTIECEDTNTLPKAFRITSIEEGEDDQDDVTITAIEVFREKWDFVAGNITLPPIVGSGRTTTFVFPPNNLRLIPQTTATGQHNLRLLWDESVTPLLRHYRVEVSINGGDTRFLGNTRVNSFTFENARPATYRFSVYAVNADDIMSAPASIEHEIVGSVSGGIVRTVEPISNLRLVDEPSPFIFRTPDAIFAWDASPDPFLRDYEVSVLDVNTDALRRIERTTNTAFTYSLDMNRADGLNRSVKISVRAVDRTGSKSVPVTISVTNPPPAAILPSVSPAFEKLYIRYQKPDLRDFAGVRLWVSPTSGFTTGSDTLFYDGPSDQIVVPVAQTVYMRIAGYDTFGKTGLNVSQEFVGTPAFVDTAAPATPTGLTLSSEIEISETGVVTARVVATVDASPSQNFERFFFDFKESSDSTFFTYESVNNQKEWRGLKPGATYRVRVRAVSRNGFISSFGPEEQITAAINTQGPAAPTNLTAVGSFKNVGLRWTNPPDADLARIEVWSNTLNNRDTATQVGVTTGDAFVHTGLGDNQTRFYWVRGVNTSGVVGLWSSGVQTTTAPQIDTSIADGSLTIAKFASGIRPVEIVSALPVSGNTQGRTVFLTTDNKLYRWDGTAWVATVAASDITGQIVANQIAANAVVAGKIAAGAVSAEQIAAGQISASKLFIGDTSNLFLDFDMEDDSFYSSPDGAIVFQTANSGVLGRRLIQLNSSDTVRTAFSEWVQCETSADYQVSGVAFLGSSATGATVTLEIEFGTLSAAGVVTPTRREVVRTQTTTTITRGTVSVVTGSTERRFRFVMTKNEVAGPSARFGGFIMRRRANGSLIVDGAITATKIAANAVTADAINANAVTAAKIAAGAVTTDKMTANSINGDRIQAGSLNADRITAGTITTDRMAAGSITASLLTLSDSNNLYPDFDLEDAAFYTSPTGASISFATSATGTHGRRILSIGSSADAHEVVSNWLPIEPGADLLVSAAVFTGNTTSGVTATLEIEFGTLAAGGVTPTRRELVGSRTNSTSSVRFNVDLSVAAGERRYRFVMSKNNVAGTTARFSGLRIQRRANAALIVDGSITAVKIAANSITGDRIAANTIVGTNIAANTISADRIDAAGVSVLSHVNPTGAISAPVSQWTTIGNLVVSSRGGSAMIFVTCRIDLINQTTTTTPQRQGFSMRIFRNAVQIEERAQMFAPVVNVLPTFLEHGGYFTQIFQDLNMPISGTANYSIQIFNSSTMDLSISQRHIAVFERVR